MKNKLKGLLAAGLIMTCILAHGESIKYQVPACETEDLLDEFTRYIIRNDSDGMVQLLASGECTILYENDTVSLIRRGFSLSQIRVNGVKYYVVSEAIKQ